MYIFIKLYIKSLLGSVSCSHISNILIELPNAPDHKALFSNRNVDFEQLKGTCLVLRTIKCMKFTDGCLLLQSTPRSSQPDHEPTPTRTRFAKGLSLQQGSQFSIFLTIHYNSCLQDSSSLPSPKSPSTGCFMYPLVNVNITMEHHHATNG